MKYFYLFLICTVFLSCTGEQTNNGPEQSNTLLKPNLIPLRTDSLLDYNVMTGLPVQPVITINADTIIPGMTYPIVGKLEPLQNLSSDQKRKVIERPTQSEIQSKTVNPVFNQIKSSAIWITQEASDKSDRFSRTLLTDARGRKVETGIPLKLEGLHQRWNQQRPTTSLPLQLLPNSFANLQGLDVDQGLQSSYILTIIEDSQHNLWFGSYGGGVVRYDGSHFTLFNMKSGLTIEIVRVLKEDSKGNIWMGTTGGGVCKFDGTSFEIFSVDEGLASDAINAILEDRNHNIWLASMGGVSKYDGEYFTHFSEKEGLPTNNILSIAEDYAGNIWFGTEKGITRYDGKKWSVLNLPEEQASSLVMTVIAASDSSVWFANTGTGIYKFKNDTLTFFREEGTMTSSFLWTITEDQHGNLWFGTSTDGVLMYDGVGFINYGEKSGLPTTEIRSICEDSRGNLWFGTYGNGAIKYNRNSFTHFDKQDGLTDNIARSILEDKSGNLWFGTSGGGLCKYDGSTYTYLDDGAGFTERIVKAIEQTEDGTIWIGTNGNGLYSFDGEYLTNYTTENGLPSDMILSIFEDSQNKLWVGTYGGGMFSLERNSDNAISELSLFSEAERFSDNIIVEIFEDNNHAMWFATDGGGLNKYENGMVTNINEACGLSNRNPITFTQDQFGNYWTGTYGGGINIFDDTHVIYLNEENGLTNNMIWSVTEIRDSAKSVFWVTTEKGINLIELFTSDKTEPTVADYQFKIHSFSKQDGLLGLDYYANSACHDSKNRMWWGSGKAVEMLNLNDYKVSNFTPEPTLNFVEINEQFIDYRNEADSFNMKYESVLPFSNYPENLILPYDQNHLTFHFSAIDWSASHKLLYQFRLVGLNQNWSAVTSKTEADYRSIPYGEYSFEVRASSESQSWSTPLSYSFTILPPWWHTWWFRFSVFMLVVVILFALYRLRTATLRVRQKQLEKTVEERTEELKKEKELVEEKHKEITDSINYAERIQRSFLATKDLLNQNLKDYFVFFQPKDVVSGDFYWASKLGNENFVLVTADSTGHGVPGAIMSIANIACLKESVTKGFHEPDEILNETRRLVIDYLKNDGSAEGGKDGMDASLISFDFQNKKLKYASANNPIWIARLNAETKNYSIIEYPADKMPVGKHDKQNTPFTGHEINLEKGDIVYTLTDGFPDQFGGEKGKKFMHKQLKELLCKIADQPLSVQQEKLKQVFFDWKGSLEQVDDVCLIGIRV